jgi:hypothetical protein
LIRLLGKRSERHRDPTRRELPQRLVEIRDEHTHLEEAMARGCRPACVRHGVITKLLVSSASALAASSEAPAEVKSKAQERASSLLR